MQNNAIQKVITRKSLLDDLAERGVHTLERLAALTVEDLPSIHSIGPTMVPRIRTLILDYKT